MKCMKKIGFGLKPLVLLLLTASPFCLSATHTVAPKIALSYYPSHDKIMLEFLLPDSRGTDILRVDIRCPEGTVVLSEEFPVSGLDIRQYEVFSQYRPTRLPFLSEDGIEKVLVREIDVSSLGNGDYSVVANLVQPGELELFSEEVQFSVMGTFEWEGNTKGMEDIVLPGFEPLRLKGNSVEMWGRAYEFDNSLMPTSIINQGREMLLRPINWNLKTGAGTYKLLTDTVEVLSSSDTRVLLEGSGTLGNFNVKSTILVEYDGFMKFDIAFNPVAGPVTVERLWMDIPLVPENSTNFHHPTRRGGYWQSGWTSHLSNRGRNSNLTHIAVVTLGTPDITLQWITESHRWYYPHGSGSALQTLEEDGARIFRTNVIGQTKDVAEPFELSFILHAGPVRPRPDNWRGIYSSGRDFPDTELHTAAGYNYTIWSRGPGDLVLREYPETKDESLRRDQLPFTSMHFGAFRDFGERDNLSKRLPEWKKYEHEWERLPRWSQGMDSPGWATIYLDTNSNWQDFHAYYADKLFNLTGVKGLYYDDWAPFPSQNTAAGSGFIDEEGVIRATYPVISQREAHRRTYAVMKKARPDSIKIVHTASTILLPVISFADIIYDGEIMIWNDMQAHNGYFFGTHTRDIYQVIFSCGQYGPIPGFHDRTTSLPGEHRQKAMTLSAQRQLWAMLLTHDIHFQSAFTSGHHDIRFIWLDEFGIAEDDVEFFPYWSDEPAVEVLEGGDPDSKYWASAYRRDEGVLVVIARDTPSGIRDGRGCPMGRERPVRTVNSDFGLVKREIPCHFEPYDPVNVIVRLDLELLGLDETSLASFDMETLGRESKGSIAGNRLIVPVGVNDFSAILIKKSN